MVFIFQFVNVVFQKIAEEGKLFFFNQWCHTFFNPRGVTCLSPVICIKQDSNQWLVVWVTVLSYQKKDTGVCVIKIPIQ